MIKYTELLDAVNRVNGNRKDLSDDVVVSDLVLSLELYKCRGEFDGSIESARECLMLAGYEVAA